MKISTMKVKGNSLNLKQSELSEFLVKIIDNNLLDRFHDNYEDFIKIAANHAMTYEDLETINKIKDAFEADSYFSSTYVDYPLVIINKNLKKEDKVEMIKSTYRKKDLNKYTKFIRENLTDMNDLDDFIEATILQNNRVRKEEEGFMDLIRRIFIGMRGEYFYVENKLDNILHVKEFVEKYKDYFSTGMVKDMIQRSDWRSQRNVVHFISQLFKEQDFEHKMIVSRASSDIGRKLFSNLTEMPEEIKGDEKLERLYFDYMTNVSSSLSIMLDNDFDLTMHYVNKYPDIFSESFRNSYRLENSGRYYGNNLSRGDSIVKFLSNLKEDNIQKFELFSEKYFSKLGMVSDLNGWRAGDDVAHDIKNFFDFIIPIFKRVTKSNPAFKPYLYNKYFIKFEDDDYMNDMVTEVSTILNTDKIGRDVVNELNESDLQTLVARKFNALRDFVEELNPESVMKDNVEKARDELVIICSL
jgi:hypothetical protein